MEPYHVGVQQIAGAQDGRVHAEQLGEIGLTRGLIRSLERKGVLIRTQQQVYAVGHVRTDLAARNWEAVLYAGPGASLAGGSGAHRCDLLQRPPSNVIVATPRRCRSVPGIVVLSGRPPERTVVNGIPVAPIPELMLELAAAGDFAQVRFALANLEYQRRLDIQQLLDVCGRGRKGSQLLKRALAHRLPQLAHTRGPLEVAFLLLLDAHHLPLPVMNRWVCNVLVDAYWPQLSLVVELDGKGNHGTAAQQRLDAEKMATLRAAGLTVIRFDDDDVRRSVSATLMTLAGVGVR